MLEVRLSFPQLAYSEQPPAAWRQYLNFFSHASYFASSIPMQETEEQGYKLVAKPYPGMANFSFLILPKAGRLLRFEKCEIIHTGTILVARRSPILICAGRVRQHIIPSRVEAKSIGEAIIRRIATCADRRGRITHFRIRRISESIIADCC
jgi:hypothetical protein